MLKISDLRLREVVNVIDGRRLGFVHDLDIDLEEGRVRGFTVIEQQGRLFGILGGNSEIYIAWEQVIRIGTDVILVEIDSRLPHAN
ncbi:MAG: YlmC/YmxH family sporulation protein [Firmicutes bacterium]|nr:YlmC/YmxH family sporulation protein [Bacillota bacterium]